MSEDKLDRILRELEHLQAGVRLLDARGKDFDLRLSHLEARPPMRSTTSEAVDRVRDSIRPLREETEKQTPMIEGTYHKAFSLARDQKFIAFFTAVAAIASLLSVILHK